MLIVRFLSCLPFAVIAVAVFFTARTLFEQNKPAGRTVFYIAGTIGLYSFGEFVVGPLYWVSHARLEVCDPVIYRIEALTGLACPALVDNLFRLVLHWPGIFVTLLIIYDSLTLLVVLAASSEACHADWSITDNLYVRFAVGALVGFALYYILPAVGPGPFFGKAFPGDLPASLASPHAFTLFADGGVTDRNAMPSLHATWTILCFLALRRSPLWHRCLGALYVAVTFMITIGMGYHYLLDWVVALPLVLLIRALTSSRPVRARLVAFGTGGGLLLLWCAIIRLAPWSLAHPDYIQAVILASVILPVMLERRLAFGGVFGAGQSRWAAARGKPASFAAD